MNDPPGPAWQRLNHSALLRFLLLACGWAVLAGLLGVFLAIPTTGMVVGWGKQEGPAEPPATPWPIQLPASAAESLLPACVQS